MMNYEDEISALKKTVFELLDVNERQQATYKKVLSKYKDVHREYKQIHQCLMRKDESFQVVVDRQNNHTQLLEKQINKLNELEDVLEDMV